MADSVIQSDVESSVFIAGGARWQFTKHLQENLWMCPCFTSIDLSFNWLDRGYATYIL